MAIKLRKGDSMAAKKVKWTVEYADSQIQQWETIKGVIMRSDIKESDDFETRIYKLYLQYTSVSEVAKILSAEGFKMPSTTGGRVISSNDVSAVIQEKDISDNELQKLVRNIFSNATKFINSIYN